YFYFHFIAKYLILIIALSCLLNSEDIRRRLMDIKIKYGIIALIIILIQSSLKTVGVLITGSLSFLSETVDTLTDIFFVSLTIYSLRSSF
ncbi:unnamed protein product, partial [marine sediment metagenome]